MLKNKACYSAIVVMFFLINATVATSIISVRTAAKSNTITGVYLSQYKNITVDEAWAFVNCTCDGVQIPIDVRTDQEWVTEHIQTPAPENARHHCLSDWDNESVLQQFMTLYDKQMIILYCGIGGRSWQATKILLNNNFTGYIYNMIGGMNEWKLHGYPTVGNFGPVTPTIQGTTGGKIGEGYEYAFNTTDPEGNDIYYYVQWGDGNTTDGWMGPYPSGKLLTLNHTWTSQGAYNITAKAKDSYGTESDWGVLAISMPKTHACWFENFIKNLFESLLRITFKIR